MPKHCDPRSARRGNTMRSRRRPLLHLCRRPRGKESVTLPLEEAVGMGSAGLEVGMARCNDHDSPELLAVVRTEGLHLMDVTGTTACCILASALEELLSCFGSKVDAIGYYKSEIEKIGKEGRMLVLCFKIHKYLLTVNAHM